MEWAIDTDVNAAALAELHVHQEAARRRGDAKIPQNCAYITVGTGVGIGVVCNGCAVHGALHPEGGHVKVPRYQSDLFEGVCPYHGDCIEGMVSSGALAKRLGVERSALRAVDDSNPVWACIAHYIAAACAALVYVVSPEFIVLGGGIMNRKCLFPLVREQLRKNLAGYISMAQLRPENIDRYVVPASYGSLTGVQGALALARRSLAH